MCLLTKPNIQSLKNMRMPDEKPLNPCWVMLRRLGFLGTFVLSLSYCPQSAIHSKVSLVLMQFFCFLGYHCSTKHFPTQTDNSIWWQPSVSLPPRSLAGIWFLCVGWSLTMTYLACYLLAHKFGLILQNNSLILPAWKASKIFISTLVSNTAERLLVYCKSI